MIATPFDSTNDDDGQPRYRVFTESRHGSGTGETRYRRWVLNREGKKVHEDHWDDGPGTIGRKPPPLPDYIEKSSEGISRYLHNATAPATTTIPSPPDFGEEEILLYEQFVRARRPETKVEKARREFEESIKALGIDIEKLSKKPRPPKRGRCRRHRQFNCNVPGC